MPLPSPSLPSKTPSPQNFIRFLASSFSASQLAFLFYPPSPFPFFLLTPPKVPQPLAMEKNAPLTIALSLKTPFEDPHLQADSGFDNPHTTTRFAKAKPKKNKQSVEIEAENFESQAMEPCHRSDQYNQEGKTENGEQLEFGCRVEKKKQGLVPIRNEDLQEYLRYKGTKLVQLRKRLKARVSCLQRRKNSC